MWGIFRRREEEDKQQTLHKFGLELKDSIAEIKFLKEELEHVKIIALETKKIYLSKLTKFLKEEESRKEEEKESPDSIFIAGA